MAPSPDSLDDGDHALNNRLSWVSSSSSSSSSSQTDEPFASRRRWGSVKTWMFGQLLASSFARVSLQDEGLHATERSDDDNGSKKHSSTASSSATVSTSSSCSSLASLAPLSSSTTSSSSSKATPQVASSSSSGGNDWDCSYASLSTTTKRSNQEPPTPIVQSGTRYEFDMYRVIGSGSYGTVLLSRLRDDPTQLFAIKMVPKQKLSLDRNNCETLRLLTEKNVLASIDHPFITKLYCAFETEQSLNFVMEYCAGGDMYFLLEKFAKNRMPEHLVVFYAASIALALSYLHQRGILYRDLKPENLLLDRQGFLRLADFGFAREHMQAQEQCCKTFCGSADYIAPEVVAGTGYGLSADLWSFGCVLYELLTGFPPFYSPRDRSMLFRKIERAEPSFPKHFSPEARDLLSKLLHKDVSQRLGSGPNGMGDVFAHPFFASIDWYQLSTMQVVPPFVPKLSSPADTSNFEPQFTSQHVDGSVVYEEKHDDELQQAMTSGGGDHARLFDDFDWCADASAFA